MLALAALAFALCTPGRPAVQQPTCVTDGDTFRINAERVRIENIDTPELQAKCPDELRRAQAARDRLQVLLSSGEMVIDRNGTDRNNRTLARVRVNGRDVGEALVREGHARPWTGRRQPRC